MEGLVDGGDPFFAGTFPVLPGLLPLPLHAGFEPRLVEVNPSAPDDVGGQVRGKAEGVVELEDDLAGDDFRPGFSGRPPRR